MENDDAEKRIADLERQLAEQKRIAELERQLADAKSATGQGVSVEQSGDPAAQRGLNYAQAMFDGLRTGRATGPQGPSGPDISQMRDALSQAASQAGMSQEQLDAALQNANVTMKTGHSVSYPGQQGAQGFQTNATPSYNDISSFAGSTSVGRQRRSLADGAGNLIGWLGGAFGIVVGGAAVLTAAFPSTALWTSSIVCGGTGKLMSSSSNYSYKPGQSGTSVSFQCLGVDGATDANWFAISALQAVVVAAMLVGVVAVGLVVRKLRRRQTVSPTSAIVACGLALLSLAAIFTIVWSAVSSATRATQMPQGGSLVLDGNGESKTIACNGGHLTVKGRDMSVTVTDHCGRLSVDGVINHITVNSVDAIDVDGIHNVVTFHSGSPKVTNSGGQNTVGQG